MGEQSAVIGLSEQRDKYIESGEGARERGGERDRERETERERDRERERKRKKGREKGRVNRKKVERGERENEKG